MLGSSKLLSEYIGQLLYRETRSVWIAQREGRTKDGNDVTNPGVLKMLAMAKGDETIIEYFKKIKIVPVSISYHYDPTDALKMPQLMAEANNEIYTKQKNEDFKTMISGVVGQKKGIHIHIGDVLNEQLDQIAVDFFIYTPLEMVQVIKTIEKILRFSFFHFTEGNKALQL